MDKRNLTNINFKSSTLNGHFIRNTVLVLGRARALFNDNQHHKPELRTRLGSWIHSVNANSDQTIFFGRFAAFVTGGLEAIPAVIGERRGTHWTGRQCITGPYRDKRDKRLFTLTILTDTQAED